MRTKTLLETAESLKPQIDAAERVINDSLRKKREAANDAERSEANMRITHAMEQRESIRRRTGF